MSRQTLFRQQRKIEVLHKIAASIKGGRKNKLHYLRAHRPVLHAISVLPGHCARNITGAVQEKDVSGSMMQDIVSSVFSFRRLPRETLLEHFSFYYRRFIYLSSRPQGEILG